MEKRRSFGKRFKVFAGIAVAMGVAASALAAERIVFIGDSITGQSRISAHGYANQLDDAYAATRVEADRPVVVALGGSGQTVESWRNVEFESRENATTTLDVPGVYVGPNLDQPTDRLVVLLGMNNVLAPSTADTPESIAAFKGQLLPARDEPRPPHDRARPLPRVGPPVHGGSGRPEEPAHPEAEREDPGTRGRTRHGRNLSRDSTGPVGPLHPRLGEPDEPPRRRPYARPRVPRHERHGPSERRRAHRHRPVVPRCLPACRRLRLARRQPFAGAARRRRERQRRRAFARPPRDGRGRGPWPLRLPPPGKLGGASRRIGSSVRVVLPRASEGLERNGRSRDERAVRRFHARRARRVRAHDPLRHRDARVRRRAHGIRPRARAPGASRRRSRCPGRTRAAIGRSSPRTPHARPRPPSKPATTSRRSRRQTRPARHPGRTISRASATWAATTPTRSTFRRFQPIPSLARPMRSATSTRRGRPTPPSRCPRPPSRARSIRRSGSTGRRFSRRMRRASRRPCISWPATTCSPCARRI
jgi:hypothetical protein